jgi:hypothetical protein
MHSFYNTFINISNSKLLISQFQPSMSDIRKAICSHCHVKLPKKSRKACSECRESFYCSKGYVNKQCLNLSTLFNISYFLFRLSKSGLAEARRESFVQKCVDAVELLKSEPLSATSAEKGCSDIADLALGSVSCRKYLGRLGACEAVLAAVRAYSGNVKVVFEALAAISSLASNSVNRKRMLDLSMDKLLISVMQSPAIVNEDIARFCMGAVANFVTNIDFDSDQISDNSI